MCSGPKEGRSFSGKGNCFSSERRSDFPPGESETSRPERRRNPGRNPLPTESLFLPSGRRAGGTRSEGPDAPSPGGLSSRVAAGRRGSPTLERAERGWGPGLALPPPAPARLRRAWVAPPPSPWAPPPQGAPGAESGAWTTPGRSPRSRGDAHALLHAPRGALPAPPPPSGTLRSRRWQLLLILKKVLFAPSVPELLSLSFIIKLFLLE